MRRLSAALLALCLNVVCPAANGETISRPTPEASALQKVLNAKGSNDSTNDPRWRLSLAAALHRYCQSILVQVPPNTPQEDRWIDDEFRELRELPFGPTHDRRFARVENSVELARQS